MNTRKTKRWHKVFSQTEGDLLTVALDRANYNYRREKIHLEHFQNSLDEATVHGESLSRRSPLNERKIERYKDDIETQKRTVKIMEKRIEQTKKDIKYRDKNPEGGDATLALMLKLEKHPMIEKVSVERNNLIVLTKPLEAEITRTAHGGHDGEDWSDEVGISCGMGDIGVFKIIIGQQGDPEIRNQTLMFNGNYDHWAISNGNVCVGDYSEQFINFRKSGNIFLYVDIILHFLTDAVGDDLFIDRREWIEKAQKIGRRDSAPLEATLKYHDIMLGDFVEVTDYKQYYPRWASLSDEMGATKWKNEQQPENGMYGKLIASKENTNMGSVALIDDGKNQFLINYGGLREIEEDAIEDAIETKISKRDKVEEVQTIKQPF